MNEFHELSEHVERQTVLSLHELCPEETREELGLFLEEVGDTLVSGAVNDPSILLNRAMGLGTREPVSREKIREIDSLYRGRGVGRYFLQVYPSDLPEGDATFEGTGLVKARGWMKFERDDSEPPERGTDLEIRRVGIAGAADFGRIAVAAFDMTPAAGPLVAGLVNDPRWYLYVSYEGDTAAGTGGMIIVDNAAWLDWGATDPPFRRRGSQGAIMRARIEAAREAGCTVMFTETGEAAGDDPQHSYGNIQRFGFTESILRQNWAPA